MFLPYKDMWDMPIDACIDEKHIPHWFGNLAWVFLGALTKVLFRWRVDHRQNLRGFAKKSGVVVVANHTSFLDVAFMYLAARPSQWVRFMARDTLFDNGHGLLGQIISRVGAFPVKRDSADRVSVKRAVHMLKNKEVVGILPEGTRRGKGDKVPEIHAGAAFVARLGGAPLLPMTVRNAELVKQTGKGIRFPKITIDYGTPVLLSDFDFLPKEERMQACSWYVMRECFALSLRVASEQVDMRSLFPQDKDYTELFRCHRVPTHTTDELVGALQASDDPS